MPEASEPQSSDVFLQVICHLLSVMEAANRASYVGTVGLEVVTNSSPSWFWACAAEEASLVRRWERHFLELTVFLGWIREEGSLYKREVSSFVLGNTGRL